MGKFRMPMFDQDGEGGGASTEPTSIPVTETPVVQSTPYQPLMDYNPLLQSEPTPPATPQEPPATIEELDFSGRKVQVVDPVIRDIHKDYSALQKTYNETNMSMKSLQEQNQIYQNMIQTFQQQGQAPQAQAPEIETAPGPTPEDNESFMSKWYDDPILTVEAMIQARVDAALKPMQQEKAVNSEIQTLQEKYADFHQHVDSMQEILRANPQLADQGLETVYFVARGQQTSQQAPTPTPEQLLNDPQFRTQLMGNEQFRNEIISSYMQTRTNTNQQVPPVMGNQPGGNPPAIPENRPTSIKEASRMFAKSLGF